MKNNRFALFALLLVQLFYGVTFTFANDVIDGRYCFQLFYEYFFGDVILFAFYYYYY